MPENLHDYKTAANRLGIAEQTLRTWVSQGRIDHFKLGRAVRFSDDQLTNFLSDNLVQSGGRR